MSKFFKEIISEHKEYSIKRVLVVIFTIIASFVAIKLAYVNEIKEHHIYLLGELFSFIAILLGLTMTNKHKSFRKSTNIDEDEV